MEMFGKRTIWVVLGFLVIGGTFAFLGCKHSVSESYVYIHEYGHADVSEYIDEHDSRSFPTPIENLPTTTNLLEFAEQTNLSVPIREIIDVFDIPANVAVGHPDNDLQGKPRFMPQRTKDMYGAVEIYIQLDNGMSFSVDETTGQMTSFEDWIREWRERAPKLDSPLAEGQCMEIVHKLLEAESIFGAKDSDISIVLEESTTEIYQWNNYSPPRNVWSFTARKKYKGFEFSGNTEFTIGVNIDTGEIMAIRNPPLVLPNKIEENITLGQALSIAQSLGEERSIPRGALKVRKLILNPNAGWMDSFNGYFGGYLPEKRLCWMLTWCYEEASDKTYSYDQDPYGIRKRVSPIYLDSKTGKEIIDASIYRHRGPSVIIDVGTGKIIGGWNGEKVEH